MLTQAVCGNVNRKELTGIRLFRKLVHFRRRLAREGPARSGACWSQGILKKGCLYQGTLTEGKGSVRLTSSVRQLVL